MRSLDERTTLSPDVKDATEAALLRLLSNFGILTDDAAYDLQLDTWITAMERQAHWITPELIDGALEIYLDRKTDSTAERKPPPIGDFIDVCRAVKAAAQRQERPALLAPERRVVDALDPNDPYSCTPEERERWAREDRWIRQWSARVRFTPPEVMARLLTEDRQRLEESEENDRKVMNWPNLTPAARRAKDIRIERARQAALKSLRDAGKEKAARMLEKIPDTYHRNTDLGVFSA